MKRPISIRCDHVTVGYPDRPVVRDFCLTLHPGEILTLIGPNGAGKSTMLKSIARHIPLQGGTIYLDQTDLRELKPKELARQMAVLMTQGKNPGMITCREVIAMGRFPYTNLVGTMTEKDREVVRQAMEQTGVADLADRDYTKISDGQRQRVLLARALCQEPEILILDEPVSYLDIRYKLEFLTTLQHLVREKQLTVVMSLHEVDLAARISDRIACIRDGSVHREGTPEEVFSGRYVEELFELPAGTYEELSGCVELGRVPGTPRVFVLCGNGTGTRIFRILQRHGIPFCAGILWENDMDCPAADALAQEVIRVPAYAPVTEADLAAAKTLADRCGAMVCTQQEEDLSNAAEPLKELLRHAREKGILKTTEEIIEWNGIS